jgi:hypothetical protein
LHEQETAFASEKEQTDISAGSYINGCALADVPTTIPRLPGPVRIHVMLSHEYPPIHIVVRGGFSDAAGVS